MVICSICGHNNLAGNMASQELSGGFINCRGCGKRLDHTGKQIPLTISQLIEQLEDIKAEHGDLPVYVEYDGDNLEIRELAVEICDGKESLIII